MVSRDLEDNLELLCRAERKFQVRRLGKVAKSKCFSVRSDLD
jgi:hypothetical protein